MKLTGNTILITGGSAGIGLAFASKFKELGNEVIITGRTRSKLDAAVAEVPGVHAIQCDASDPDQLTALASTVQAEHPKTNVLFNNAGIFLNKNLAATDVDLIRHTQEIDINLSGAIRTVAALMGVITGNKGTIINVSSGLAFVPLTSAPIYCATKAGLHSYTVALRFQLQEHGVEVIELMPPAVKTALTSDLPEDGAFPLLTTDELVKATMKDLKSGKQEIRPGQANQLHWMSRIAPGFINAQLYKGSKELIPSA